MAKLKHTIGIAYPHNWKRVQMTTQAGIGVTTPHDLAYSFLKTLTEM